MAAEADSIKVEANLEEVYDKLERNLVIVGASCVEDRLQDNVPETIEDMRNGGIKVWMLTGDKLETAENIGYSCKLFTEEMEIISINTLEDAEREFNQKMAEANKERQLKMI